MPAFFTVKLWLAELPAFTVPKLTLLELSCSVWVAAMLVPLSATVAGELAALLMSETPPDTVPAACPTNCTVKELLWPALMVCGRDRPERLKPVPVRLACEIVRLLLPELMICTDCELLAPVITLEKLRLPGVTARLPCTAAPVTLSVVAGPCAFVSVINPFKEPAAAGLYFSVRVAVCAGANVSGALMPEAVRFAPATLTCEIVAGELPVLVTVTV